MNSPVFRSLDTSTEPILFLSSSVESGEHVEAHARFSALIHEFLDWMGSLRMRLERLDGVAYIGPEQSKDVLRQVETLRDNCQQGETMLIKLDSALLLVISQTSSSGVSAIHSEVADCRQRLADFSLLLTNTIEEHRKIVEEWLLWVQSNADIQSWFVNTNDALSKCLSHVGKLRSI